MQLLKANWKDYYIRGLTDCLFRNWEDRNKESLEILRNFIISQLKNYTGSRTVIGSLLTNIRFIEKDNGPIILGAELAAKGIKITQVTSYCSLPESWIKYSYFSKVIDTYYEKRKQYLGEILEELKEVLSIHNNSITNKRVVSKFIIQANQNNFTQYQQDVKLLAFEMVGDPGITSKWAPFENATESEIRNLTQARSILNEWITKEFISVFFEKCINDERRKQFWLNMSPHISAFKVFGPSNIRQTLRMDKRISDFVDARFQRTKSNIQIAAFMMRIGEYKLIEFSNQGYAFYAYKNDNPKAPSWDGRYNSVGELRDSSLPMLVHRQGDNVTDTNPEGRLVHNDSGAIKWERVFSHWMQEYLGIWSA